MPCILRGVALLGIVSVMAPLPLREQAWERLARDLDPAKLEAMIDEVPLERAVSKADALIQSKMRGRIVVSIA